MSQMIRTGSPARFTPARLGRLAVLAISVVVSACSGDAADPLESASFTHNGGHGGGNGGTSNQASSLAVPQPVATVAGSTVTVSWTAVANAIEYQVVASGDLPSRKTTATSVVYENVAAGSYTVKARALATSNHNESGFSPEAGFTVVAAPSVATDNTPPVITSSVAGTLGSNGWYTSAAALTWTVTDAESAFTSSGCDAVTVTADTHGTTYTCSATSQGGTSTASVTIKRDATVPVVGFAGNATSYTVDQSVSITCSASDVTSGVETQACPSASGDAYTFNIGSNVLAASGTDYAGNGNGATATFTVSVTAGSLCNLTRRFVSNAGIANSMCVKLDAAAAAAARGNLAAKAGSLNAYVNQVQAQSDKAVSSANAAILIRLAGLL